MLLQITKDRFLKEASYWTKSKTRFINYLENEDSYEFYLSTPDVDYCCAILKEELTSVDKMNLIGPGRKILKRLSEETNYQLVKEAISQSLQEQQDHQKAEKTLENLQVEK